MKKKRRKRNWRRVVKLWRESGLSKAEFCRQNNISIKSFTYNSLKLGAYSRDVQRVPESSSPGFARVVCDEKPGAEAQSPPPGKLVLRLDCGASLELPENFDPEPVKRLLKIAGELC